MTAVVAVGQQAQDAVQSWRVPVGRRVSAIALFDHFFPAHGQLAGGLLCFRFGEVTAPGMASILANIDHSTWRENVCLLQGSVMTEHEKASSKRPTLYDVARAAGVSHATVARVLRDEPNVRVSTWDRVSRALNETGYVPDYSARVLATSGRGVVGMIVDGIDEVGAPAAVAAFEKSLRHQGYPPRAFAIHELADADQISLIVDTVATEVGALCVFSPRPSTLEILERRPDLPPITIVGCAANTRYSIVQLDEYAGARLGVNHLVESGHRNIAHISGPPDSFASELRRAGWEDAMSAAGLSPWVCLSGGWTSHAGYNLAMSVDWTGSSAVFAASDQIALGLIHGLSARGIEVPAQMSVVGFGNSIDSKHFIPPLTTVKLSYSSLGTLAASKVVSAFGEADTVPELGLAPTLLVRESTRPRV